MFHVGRLVGGLGNSRNSKLCSKYVRIIVIKLPTFGLSNASKTKKGNKYKYIYEQ